MPYLYSSILACIQISITVILVRNKSVSESNHLLDWNALETVGWAYVIIHYFYLIAQAVIIVFFFLKCLTVSRSEFKQN